MKHSILEYLYRRSWSPNLNLEFLKAGLGRKQCHSRLVDAEMELRLDSTYPFSPIPFSAKSNSFLSNFIDHAGKYPVTPRSSNSIALVR